jgi:hypothetical protein
MLTYVTTLWRSASSIQQVLRILALLSANVQILTPELLQEGNKDEALQSKKEVPLLTYADLC